MLTETEQMSLQMKKATVFNAELALTSFLDSLAKKYTKFQIGDSIYNPATLKNLGTVVKYYAVLVPDGNTPKIQIRYVYLSNSTDTQFYTEDLPEIKFGTRKEAEEALEKLKEELKKEKKIL